MKKIIIISTLLIVLLITGFILWTNRTVSVVMLDINPSIKIDLKKDNIVKKVIAINKDGKDIITNNLKGKPLDETLNIISDNVVEKGYMSNGSVAIIVYSTGNVDSDSLTENVRKGYEEKNIPVDVILVDNITQEDKALAKKYNVSPSKAAYINMVKKENENVPLESIVNSSVNELKETKETGYYCPEGYILRGNYCEKEIERFDGHSGDVCPEGYMDYKGVCYKETLGTETGEIKCLQDGYKLVDNKCEKVETINAQPEYKCTTGELVRKGDVSPIGANDNDKYYCVDKSNGKAPTLRCLLGPHTIINGKCYVGPAPVINGGCPNNDTLLSDGCYSLDPEDQWQCPDGSIYEKSKDTFIELCPDTFTYIEPTITGYKCQEGYQTEGNKCTRTLTDSIYRVKTCPSGYKLVDNERCIDETDTKAKVSGYVCPDDRARVIGSECVIYDIIEARK